MPYDLTSNKEKQYSHLVYSGSISIGERQQAKSAVIAMCFDKNYYRALVDLRNSDLNMSESDAIKFSSSFKDTVLPENYRLAVIINSTSKIEDLIEIIISLDGVNIKYFINFDEAENWLTSI